MRTGGDRPDGRRRPGARDGRRTRRLRRGDAAAAVGQRADPGVHRLPDDIAVLPRPARAAGSTTARFAMYAGMSRAPQWARSSSATTDRRMATRALMGPMLRLDARRLRWAFGTPRYLQMAQDRAAGVARPRSPRRDRRPDSSRWSAARVQAAASTRRPTGPVSASWMPRWQRRPPLGCNASRSRTWFAGQVCRG